MAKSGKTSQPGSNDTATKTRRRLIEAAVATLKSEGFVGASAREIARRAQCNQGLVFYHFGSVSNLLLAALDAVSADRMASYIEAISGATSLAQLVDVAVKIYQEDLDQGHITVLAEMISGASSSPELSAAVAARIQPWTLFTESVVSEAMESSSLAILAKPKDIAFAVVALYLGIELLTHLDNNREPAESMFASVAQLTKMLEIFGGKQ
jgi:AcrR family transcriptional regulator